MENELIREAIRQMLETGAFYRHNEPPFGGRTPVMSHPARSNGLWFIGGSRLLGHVDAQRNIVHAVYPSVTEPLFREFAKKWGYRYQRKTTLRVKSVHGLQGLTMDFRYILHPKELRIARNNHTTGDAFVSLNIGGNIWRSNRTTEVQF